MAKSSDNRTDEILIIGNKSEESVKAFQPELTARGLSFVGITRAQSPYMVNRPCFLDGHILATIDGEGELRQGGEWRRLRAGDIFVNPPHSGEAFRAIEGKEWHFCWVHLRPAFFDGYSHLDSRVFQADPRPLHLALQGYVTQEPANSPPETVELWADLISAQAHYLIGRGKPEGRLWKTWEAVIRSPGENWTVEKLARISGLSREQLRFHCLLETGHAPMHHVASLRVKKAITLLQTTNSTLEAIAELVGYSNPFALSNRILKSTGKRPLSHRLFSKRNTII